MTNYNDECGTAEQAPPPPPDNAVKSHPPRYPLPAKKLSSSNQFDVLRAFAIASTHAKNAVAIKDVANVLNMHINSVSICNPFFSNIGLIIKQGHKFTPVTEVIEYSDKVEWNSAEAGYKLAPIIKNTWFAKDLLQRISLRPVSEEEAISLFAELSAATPEYKTQLVMLIDYLEFSGLVIRENGALQKGPQSGTAKGPSKTEQHSVTPEASKPSKEPTETLQQPINKNTITFELPIPGKDAARISVPNNLNANDWKMLTTMLDAYIQHLQGEQQ